MTLKQWQAKNPQYWSNVVSLCSDCWYVHATVVALWRLSDYAVKAVSGQGVFVVKR